MKAFKILLVLLVLGAGSWYAWDKFHSPATAATPAGGAAQGPMPITVATLKATPVQQWRQFSGRLVAVDTVEIRPRVGGAIDKIYFQPGDVVEKDAPLFLIDPRPYQAEVSQAKANLAAAKARITLSQTDLDRAQRLVGENAISRRDVDERQNANRVAQASLEGAEAALQQANLNLNYATIRAPVRGRISRAEITIGNLVNPASAPVLATIVSVDSIYADFEVDEQTYLDMFRLQSKAPSNKNGDSAFPVELVLTSDDAGAAEPTMSYPGKIVSFDNKLDAASGTIRSRAIFDNKDKALVPGMYANVRVGQAEAQDVILIPERLISTDQDKKFVYVVNGENKVAYRPVTLGGLSNSMRIITQGLQPGDRVVTDALQKIRPEMAVEPRDVPLTDTAANPDKTDPHAADTKPAAEPSAELPAKTADAKDTPEATEEVVDLSQESAVDNQGLQPIDTDKASTDTQSD